MAINNRWRPAITVSAIALILLKLAFILFTLTASTHASEISVDMGAGAVSQVLRETASQLLRQSHPLHFSFRTHNQPLLSPLAYVRMTNRLWCANLTLKFYPQTVRIRASNVRIHSVANITPNIWPISFGDEVVNVALHLGDVELAARVDDQNARMLSCVLRDTVINASTNNYWLAHTLLSATVNPMQSRLQQFVCPSIGNYISNIESSSIMNVSLNELLPPHIRDVINASDSSLYYRVTSISVEERHMRINAQISWGKKAMDYDDFPSNSSDMHIKWDNDDRLNVLIDDSAINEFIEQIDWNFQWMEELISVTSPVIPLSSREFLSTLCTSCYFLLNVRAKGPPVIIATNGTIVLEKRDRINLRVVNPDKNVTSVFVSMILAITAELRPIIDSGTLRTQVQLLDTNVVMENGAFPPSWSFFMQDLVKGMIIEMMWPELRKQIEELTYSEGIRLATSCGIDPKNTEILIRERQLGVSALLSLQTLQQQQCFKDLKSALPNAAKLLPK